MDMSNTGNHTAPGSGTFIRLDDINIRLIIREIIRNFWVVLMVAASAWMCTSAYIKTMYAPAYTATATLSVTAKGSASAYSSLDTTTGMAEVFGEVFRSDVLEKKVAKAMGTEKIEGRVETEVIPETNLLKVRVVSPSPEDAFLTLKQILETYPSISDYLFGNASLEIIQNPQIPLEPSNTFSVGLYRNLAAVAAAALACVMIAALSLLRDTVQTKEAAKHKLDGQMFGYIGHEVKNQTGKTGLSRKKGKKNRNTAALINNTLVSYHFAEEYRSLCSKLEFHMRKHQQKVLLISSASENEGKSTVSANLALSLADQKKKVLLLDCDFRKPTLHKIFEINMENRIDFAVFLDRDDLEEPDIICLEKAGVSMAANHVGYSSPQRIITSDKMKTFLEKARDEMDYIVIDSPPMMVAADAEALSQLADVSMLVVRQDCTTAGSINDCMDVLRQSTPDFVGYVLNDFQ